MTKITRTFGRLFRTAAGRALCSGVNGCECAGDGQGHLCQAPPKTRPQSSSPHHTDVSFRGYLRSANRAAQTVPNSHIKGVEGVEGEGKALSLGD
jgi:hypothetical protein